MIKRLNPYYIFYFTLFFFLIECSYFEMNKFVTSEIIMKEENETFYYNVFQTGIDNYRFEFLAIGKSDTMKLFEYYLNDAAFSALKFTNSKNRTP
jgi:hypothetical protein